jgi:hypothetical protein
MALHLLKMAVGIDDLDHLRRIRAARLAERGTSAVYTRNRPRREEEVLDGGSIYWVIRGQIRARQRVIGFRTERDDNGRRFCLIDVDTDLVATFGRAWRPFQGWRYLDPVDAPPDDRHPGGAELPDQLIAEVRALGVL